MATATLYYWVGYVCQPTLHLRIQARRPKAEEQLRQNRVQASPNFELEIPMEDDSSDPRQTAEHYLGSTIFYFGAGLHPYIYI